MMQQVQSSGRVYASNRRAVSVQAALPVYRPIHSVSSARCPAPFTAASSTRTASRQFQSVSQVVATRSRRAAVVTYASWGAPVEFSPAKLVSNTVVAPGMHKIMIDIGATAAAGYTKPGQYVQVKTTADGKAGFFAIASAPDANNQGVLELLIKVQPASTAETICAMSAGADLLASPVQGKGFPVDRIPAADFPTVLMFATGSGISPIKAVIESGVLGQRKEVRLYYGTRSKELTAYADQIAQWEAAGVKVNLVHSGSDKKYIQGVFAEDADKLSNPAGTGILLCGHKDMCTTVTDLAKAKGVEQIMMNF